MGCRGAAENSPPMHDMVSRVSAFLQGLARNQTGVRRGKLSSAVQSGVLLPICWLHPVGLPAAEGSHLALARRGGVVGRFPRLLDFRSVA